MDSDDETEMDPLKIIAQRQMHERKIKVEQPEVKLITEEDLKEIESFKADSPDSGVNTENTENADSKDISSVPAIEAEIVAIDIKEKLDSIKPKLQSLNNSLNSSHNESRSSSSCSHNLDLEPHVHYLVDKTEIHAPPPKEKFKPYRTTKSNVHDPEKERQRKQGKHWEITAATPPPIQHNGTQLLNLMDSVEIQAQYLQKLKVFSFNMNCTKSILNVFFLTFRNYKKNKLLNVWLPNLNVWKIVNYNCHPKKNLKLKNPLLNIVILKLIQLI